MVEIQILYTYDRGIYSATRNIVKIPSLVVSIKEMHHSEKKVIPRS